MADIAIGARIPTALDSAFLNYKAWCQRIGIAAGSYESWLRCERLGYGHAMSKATGLVRYQDSGRRTKQPPALPTHAPLAAL